MIAIILTSIVCGALLWLLGRTLVLGLRSGRMPHSDSNSTVDRRSSPLGFWLVTLVFAALFAVIGAVWLLALLSAADRF